MSLRVLLVTSWGQKQCGIQAHSEMLIDAVMHADAEINISPSAEALDPRKEIPSSVDIIHLNYHRALHSKWTPEEVKGLRRSTLHHVVITFHDTFGENPPDQLSQDLNAAADAFIVHEPVIGLPNAIYWRQGVPEPNGNLGYHPWHWAARPCLGTVGFDFPWKNYTLLAQITARVGWGFTIFTPEMSKERLEELTAINPWLQVYLNDDTQMVIAGLRECDATAFAYVCANSGTSAAIRLGIAARKPLLAFRTCRQFRDLYRDPIGRGSIQWLETFEELELRLRTMALTRFDTKVAALAEQESWRHLGLQYANLYKILAAGGKHAFA